MASERRLVPAAPTNMAPWVLQTLRDGPLERSELLGAIDTLARSQGFQASNLLALKKTLMKLKADKLIVNLRKGWWALPISSLIDEATAPADLSMGKRSIRVLREIGMGPEYVYILQYCDDVQRARNTAENRWNCKIGMSKNAAQRLLSNVSSTYMVQPPEVGLMIRCENAAEVEKAIHSALRYCKHSIKGNAGHEWFHTSPDHVAVFYLGWKKLCIELEQF